MLKNREKPAANPFVILREEFDDWAILFNPNTGRGFGVNPTGVYVWKLLDGEHTIDEMLAALRRDALDVPENVHADVGGFIDALVAEGLAGFHGEQAALGDCSGVGFIWWRLQVRRECHSMLHKRELPQPKWWAVLLRGLRQLGLL